MSFNYSADPRAQFLRNRVMTATPAQRIVMLYDRLVLDLQSADQAQDAAVAGAQLTHAMQIVAELQSSLDTSAGGPAENLFSLYSYLMKGLVAVRGGATEELAGLCEIVTSLREAWAKAAEILAAEPRPLQPAAGAWIG